MPPKGSKNKGGKGKGKSGKATKKPVDPSKKRKKKRHQSFKRYIFKVLKQVHPNTGMSTRAMSVMNSLMFDLHAKISKEAAALCQQNGRKTLSEREVQTAVRLQLPGELAKHAVSDGTKAVTKYNSTK